MRAFCVNNDSVRRRALCGIARDRVAVIQCSAPPVKVAVGLSPFRRLRCPLNQSLDHASSRFASPADRPERSAEHGRPFRRTARIVRRRRPPEIGGLYSFLPSVFVHFDAQRVVTGIDISNGRVPRRAIPSCALPLVYRTTSPSTSSRPARSAPVVSWRGARIDLVFGTCDRLAP